MRCVFYPRARPTSGSDRFIFPQTDIIAVQRVYYNQQYNFSYQWLLVMSTQLVRFTGNVRPTLALTA